jgi:hypothetical protein
MRASTPIRVVGRITVRTAAILVVLSSLSWAGLMTFVAYSTRAELVESATNCSEGMKQALGEIERYREDRFRSDGIRDAIADLEAGRTEAAAATLKALRDAYSVHDERPRALTEATYVVRFVGGRVQGFKLRIDGAPWRYSEALPDGSVVLAVDDMKVDSAEAAAIVMNRLMHGDARSAVLESRDGRKRAVSLTAVERARPSPSR